MDAFSENLKKKMDDYVHGVYKVTRSFPKEEKYGVVSQIRRAALSVILNYIEGYARKRNSVKKNFWEISYGSLQESKYLISFCLEEAFIKKDESVILLKLGDEIGAMLWKSINSIKND